MLSQLKSLSLSGNQLYNNLHAYSFDKKKKKTRGKVGGLGRIF